MEEAALPQTEQATIEWLRAQLDAKEVQLMRLRGDVVDRNRLIERLSAIVMKNKPEIEGLQKIVEDQSDELHVLSTELDATKRKLAEQRAWAEIALDEHQATRNSLHELITGLALERS